MADYKSVAYFTAPSDGYPGDDPDWDPQYGYGLLVTGCNSDDGLNKYRPHRPSDCFWMIPGANHEDVVIRGDWTARVS